MNRRDMLRLAAAAPVVALLPAEVEAEILPFNDEELVRDLLSGPLYGTSIGPNNTGPGLLRCIMDGDVEARRRVNPAECGCCEGQYSHVYRWVEPTGWREEVPSEWYCICGYSEWALPAGTSEIWVGDQRAKKKALATGDGP